MRLPTLSLLAGLLMSTAAAADGATLSPELQRLGLSPGIWSAAQTPSPDAGVAWVPPKELLVRAGPGGQSLLLEGPDSLQVLTFASGAYTLLRFEGSGPQPVRLTGKLREGTLTLEGKTGAKLLVVTLAVTPSGLTVTERTGASRGALKDVTPPLTYVFAARPQAAGRVTGVGGIFFKVADGKKVREWYAQQLGLPAGAEGPWLDLRYRELDDPHRIARVVWATFKPETKHFDGPVMINYRVDNLEALLKKLAAAGVKPERTEDEPGNGRFAWVRDPAGSLVELWEPPPNG